MGGELVGLGRKRVSWLGEVLREGGPRESMKRVLAFQGRSPGAPGPLTLKEVEELEQLTQQLMHDMEHPQRQNVAVNGELPGEPLGPRPWPCGAAQHLGSAPCRGGRTLACFFLPFTSVLSGLPRVLWPVSSAAGTHPARGPGSGAAVPRALLHLPPV